MYVHIIMFSGKQVGDAILYFGCRKRSEDYIYEDELKNYLDDGTLTKVSGNNCSELAMAVIVSGQASVI